MYLSGISEVFFLVALTLSGERENGDLHIIFFIGFIISCALYFPLVTFYSKKNIALWFRAIITVFLYFLSLSISVSFTLNQQYCLDKGIF